LVQFIKTFTKTFDILKLYSVKDCFYDINIFLYKFSHRDILHSAIVRINHFEICNNTEISVEPLKSPQTLKHKTIYNPTYQLTQELTKKKWSKI